MGAHGTPPGAGAGHLAALQWEDPAGGGAGPRQAGPEVTAGAGRLPQAVMPRAWGREVSKGGTGAAGRGEHGKAPRQAGRAPGSWERQAAETGGHTAAQGSVSRSAARLLRGPLGSAATPPHPPQCGKGTPAPLSKQTPQGTGGSHLPKTTARHGHRQDTTQNFGAGPARSTRPGPS